MAGRTSQQQGRQQQGKITGHHRDSNISRELATAGMLATAGTSKVRKSRDEKQQQGLKGRKWREEHRQQQGRQQQQRQQDIADNNISMELATAGMLATAGTSNVRKSRDEKKQQGLQSRQWREEHWQQQGRQEQQR
jgi:hypothetical protein